MSQFPDTKRAAEYGAGSRDFFKFEKGDNRLRILAISQEPVATHFIGKKPAVCVGVSKGCRYHGENAPKDEQGKPKRPSVKYPAYALDRKAGDIRLVFLPYSIVTALEELKKDADWSFDELPMPYDITVKYDPDASGTEMYKVIPSPKSLSIPQETLDNLAKMKNIDGVAEAQREKAEIELDPLPETESGEIEVDEEVEEEETPEFLKQ